MPEHTPHKSKEPNKPNKPILHLSMVTQMLTLLHKDLRREWRSKEITTTTIAFSVLLMLIFSFAFVARHEITSKVFPGILWVSILFSGVLALGRTFEDEKESGCLRALALIPGTAHSLYVSKLLSNLAVMVSFEICLLPLLGIAFNIPMSTLYALPMMTSIILGTLGFVILGTLLSAMLVHHKMREVMMPLILFPLIVPLLIGGVKSTLLMHSGQSENLKLAWEWLRMMAAMDLIFLFGSVYIFKWVLGAIE